MGSIRLIGLTYSATKTTKTRYPCENIASHNNISNYKTSAFIRFSLFQQAYPHFIVAFFPISLLCSVLL